MQVAAKTAQMMSFVVTATFTGPGGGLARARGGGGVQVSGNIS